MMNSDAEHVVSLADAIRRFLTRDTTGQLSWRSLVEEMGLLEIALENPGDMALHHAIHQELGRALMVVPFNESVAFGCHYQGACEFPGPLRADLGSGAITLAVALDARQVLAATPTGSGAVLTGTAPGVCHARHASHLLAAANANGEMLLVLVPVAKARAVPCDSVDDAAVADLHFDDVQLADTAILAFGQDAVRRIADIMNRLVVGQCAEATGLLAAMIEMTRDYALGRMQFGQSIASFQVNRHRFADMQMALACAQAITGWVIENGSPAMAASAAKVEVADALRQVREHAVQIHGAMGLTDEMRISHYFRRALALEQRLGNADYHLRRYAALAMAG